MAVRYITYGEFQQYMKDYYFRTGSRMQFMEMAHYLDHKGLLYADPPHPILARRYPHFTNMTDAEFNQIVDDIVLTIDLDSGRNQIVAESDIIPIARDVFVIRHPRYTRPDSHRHNYYELDYVAGGHARFFFEDSEKVMQAGEICLVSPGASHDVILDDDSTVFCIMFRKSTFDTVFFSQLSQQNLLANFFRMTLQNPEKPNYLQFFCKIGTPDSDYLRMLIFNMMGETNNHDECANNCVINLAQLLFSHLLRCYSRTVQFYDFQAGTDFSLILQYIQHNYKTITMSSLADLFNYSEPHLCTMIRQNTGQSFTALIRRLRMADAVNYLTNTSLKIGEIAEAVGYNSSDHFSRVFRSTYKMSPQNYRSQYQKTGDHFLPFEEV